MNNTELDLTKEEDVVTLMKSSTSERNWNENCDKVKKANNGYPSFWFKAIIIGGVARDTSSKWGGDDAIHVTISN